NLEILAESTHRKPLLNLAKSLMDDLEKNSVSRTMRFQHDTLTVQCIYPKTSKPILDEIDRVLARHYGFTEEELDFILNYDIKYRMGQANADEQEEYFTMPHIFDNIESRMLEALKDTLRVSHYHAFRGRYFNLRV